MKRIEPDIAYLVDDGETCILRVLVAVPGKKKRVHNFTLDTNGFARLGAECAGHLCSVVQRGAQWSPRKPLRKSSRSRTTKGCS